MKRLLLIFLSTLLVVYVLLALYVGSYVHAFPSKTADAAIVLGARSYKNGSYNPCLVSRVTTAVTLYKTHKVPILIMSGGDDKEDKVNEAETMRKMALEHILPESNIVLESKSTSTFENLQNSKITMQENTITSAIIVTEPFHIARARLVARSLGIAAEYKAAEHSPCWEKWKYASRYFLKEPIAILSYMLTGKIHLTAFF